MNAKTNTDIDKPPTLVRRILSIMAMALGGAVAGYTVATFTADNIKRWEDDVALVVATATIGMALISAVIVAIRPQAIPKGCGVLQVIVLLLSGLMMLAPIYGPQFAGAEFIYWGILAVLVIQSLANLWLWRMADEMLRNIMVETSALSFWALQLALFLYACAERLELIGSVSAWGMLGILMCVYLIASSVVAARRGMT